MLSRINIVLRGETLKIFKTVDTSILETCLFSNQTAIPCDSNALRGQDNYRTKRLRTVIHERLELEAAVSWQSSSFRQNYNLSFVRIVPLYSLFPSQSANHKVSQLKLA